VPRPVVHCPPMRSPLSVRFDTRNVKAIEDVSAANGGNINRAINQLIRAGHPALAERASYKRFRASRDTIRAEMLHDANAALSAEGLGVKPRKAK